MLSEEWTVTEEEYEACTQAALELAQLADCEALPSGINKEWWGFLYYGDASPAIGGGIFGFSWFPDKGRLLDYLANHLTFLHPGPSRLDPGRVRREAQTHVATYLAGSTSESEFMNNLNHSLRGFTQVEWMGSLEELLSGDSGFGLRWRMKARGVFVGEDGRIEEEEKYTADEINQAKEPVKDSDIPTFVQALSEATI